MTYGSFVSTFVVPSEVEPGSYDIRVEDDAGNAAEAELECRLPTSLSARVPPLLRPAMSAIPLTISGNGFKANWPITITYAS